MADTLRTGRVLSNKMQKTIIVVVDRLEHDPIYKKAIRRVSKLYAHDPKGEAKPGDVVQLQQVRPLSKNKRWLVKGIVSKSAAAQVDATLGTVESEAKSAGQGA
ncbi:MAG: 30S ribosomal protein S17 [Dehalococcoidia bacterium]|nr:30S ribosomal protein S17 [Dehalococcoidia bacterium]